MTLQIFIEVLNKIFHFNPPSGNRVDSCGQTDGRTDMAKVIGAFRDYARALKMVLCSSRGQE